MSLMCLMGGARVAPTEAGIVTVEGVVAIHKRLKSDVYISLADYANFLGFRGLVTLLPNFCQLSVPEVGVCGVYSESP